MDDLNRQLYSWPCDSLTSSPSPHAFAEALGLCGERIALLESSDVRACVVTERGKVATLYDKLLRGMCVCVCVRVCVCVCVCLCVWYVVCMKWLCRV